MKVQTFKTINVQGFKFRTKASEEYLNTQNSGVVVKAYTSRFLSTRDSSPSEVEVTYYGIIKDIVQLSFMGGKRIILFECDWADIQKYKIDTKGFTLVDFTRPDLKVNPFVLPSQVLQAFYVKDPRDAPWMVPVITKPRDNFDMYSVESTLDTDDGYLEILPIQTHVVIEE